jgi:hypothetical protein
VEVVEVEDC